MALELLDLHREHFDASHLRAEALHDPLQRIGNLVRDEQQPQTSRGEFLATRSQKPSASGSPSAISNFPNLLKHV